MITSKIAMLLSAAALVSCGAADDWTPEDLSLGTSKTEDAVLRRGRLAYSMYCAGCHGEKRRRGGPGGALPRTPSRATSARGG